MHRLRECLAKLNFELLFCLKKFKNYSFMTSLLFYKVDLKLISRKVTFKLIKHALSNPLFGMFIFALLINKKILFIGFIYMLVISCQSLIPSLDSWRILVVDWYLINFCTYYLVPLCYQPHWTGEEDGSWFCWWYWMATTSCRNASSWRWNWKIYGNTWWY